MDEEREPEMVDGERRDTAVVDFQRPQTAQAAVLGELRRLILDGVLRPGAAIRQESIAATLGVSRVPVREALKILEGEGQITYRPHRGYSVTELSYADIAEIYRLRDLLEGEAVRAAVPRLTPADLGRMRAALEDLERIDHGRVAAMSEANNRFHYALLERSQMPHLLKHIRLLRQATEAYRSLYYMDDHTRDVVDGEHREILAAAEAGDANRTEELTRLHRQHALEAYERLLATPAT